MAERPETFEDCTAPVWERQAYEPRKWHSRFKRYMLLGEGRSYVRAYQQERLEQTEDPVERHKISNRVQAPGAWKRKAQAWWWIKRAERWDAAQRRQDEREWEQRARQLREKEWDVSMQLFERAREMLDVDLTRTSWNQNTIRLFLETASALGRQASGLDHEIDRLLRDVDFDKLGLDQLEALEEGANPIEVLMQGYEPHDDEEETVKG